MSVPWPLSFINFFSFHTLHNNLHPNFLQQPDVVFQNRIDLVVKNLIRQIHLHALLHGQIQLYIFDRKAFLGAFRNKTADTVQNILSNLENGSIFFRSSNKQFR